MIIKLSDFPAEEVKIKIIIVEGDHDSTFVGRIISADQHYENLVPTAKKRKLYNSSAPMETNENEIDLSSFYNENSKELVFEKWGYATIKRPVIFVNKTEKIILVLAQLGGDKKYGEIPKILSSIYFVLLDKYYSNVKISTIVQLDMDYNTKDNKWQDRVEKTHRGIEDALQEFENTSIALTKKSISILNDKIVKDWFIYQYLTSNYTNPAGVLFTNMIYTYSLTTNNSSSEGNLDSMLVNALDNNKDTSIKLHNVVRFISNNFTAPSSIDKVKINILGQQYNSGANNTTIIGNSDNDHLFTKQIIETTQFYEVIIWFLNH